MFLQMAAVKVHLRGENNTQFQGLPVGIHHLLLEGCVGVFRVDCFI
jgi:hypothetical protein